VNHHLLFLSFTKPVDKRRPEMYKVSAGIINSTGFISLSANKLKTQNVNSVLQVFFTFLIFNASCMPTAWNLKA
jgi:hypothetical protein